MALWKKLIYSGSNAQLANLYASNAVTASYFKGDGTLVTGVVSSSYSVSASYAPGGAGGGSVATDTIWDTKGDLAVGTGADAAAKLPVGADGFFLQASSSASTGLVYADPNIQLLNAQTGSTYTLVLIDHPKLVTLSNASAITLTVPPNSSVAFPVGSVVDLAQIGAGQVTIATGSGVTINSTPGLKLRARYSGATLRKTATDTWLLFGDLAT